MNPLGIDASGSVTDQRSWSLRLGFLQHYGLAVLSVGIALGASLLLQYFHFRGPAVPLLLSAVAISSWYGGTGPAVLAVILSISGFYWYFVEPVRTIYVYPSEIPFFIVFVGFAVLLSWFCVVRRRAEKDLRDKAEALGASEAHLAEAQRVSHTGSWYLDIAHDRLSWSDEVFRIFGMQFGTPLTYETFLAAVYADDRAFVDEAWNKAMRGAPYDIEHRILVGRELRWVREQAQLEFDVDGTATKGIGTVQDITERKRSEEAVREKAALLDLTHDTVFVMDMEGVIKYWNRGAEERYGWTAEQAAGKVVHDLLKTGFAAPLEGIKAEVTRTGWWEGELVHTKKDGTQVVVASRWALQCDERGAPVAILETNNDITEPKRAEEALRRSEAYLTEAQKLSHTGSFAFDVTSNRYIYTSQECLRIFELDPQQSLPPREAVSRFIHPEDWDRVQRDFEKLLREKVDTSSEFRIVLPSGAVKHIQVIRHPLLNGAGEAVTIVGTAMDVTERQRAEQAQRESETRFRTFVDHAGDALFVHDFEEFTVVDVNRSACESLGYTREELVGMPALAFHLDSDQERMESDAARAETGETVSGRHWHRRKDGTLFPVEARTSSFWYGGRRFLLHVARDISDQLRAEEERERLGRLEADLAHINRVSMMGELAASIAHEVNQPLSGIVSNASASLRFLAADAPDLEEVREAVRDIVRDGKRAGEVIAHIRALTKMAATTREKLDLNDIIREVLALVGDEAKKNSVIVRTQFADDLSPVAGDRVQLQQVVLNLVMNAIEAMRSIGDRVRELVIITGEMDADHVQVTVGDSGPGLDPNTMDKIFDSFYSTKPSGMGMGLSISRSILQAHGGRLWVAAKDSLGATFHFTVQKYHEEGLHAGATGTSSSRRDCGR